MSSSLSLHETLIPYSVSNRGTALASTNGKMPRPQVRGKFFFIGRDKFFVRGVTYGTFRPRADGIEYPEPEIIEKDFTAISTKKYARIGGEPFFMSESVIRKYSLKIQLPKFCYPSHFNRFAFSIDEIWRGFSLDLPLSTRDGTEHCYFLRQRQLMSTI